MTHTETVHFFMTCVLPGVHVRHKGVGRVEARAFREALESAWKRFKHGCYKANEITIAQYRKWELPTEAKHWQLPITDRS